MEQCGPHDRTDEQGNAKVEWTDDMYRRRRELLRIFEPHFMAGLADYQAQRNEEPHRESYTLFEEPGGTSIFTHSNVSGNVRTNATRGSNSEILESMDVTGSILVDLDENDVDSGNATIQRLLHEKDVQIEEMRGLNEELRGLNEQLKDELHLAGVRINELEQSVEKLRDDLILGTKSAHS